MKQADTPDTSLEAADAALYGGVGVRESGRMLGMPIDIMKISANKTQPRRPIPMLIRGDWDGSPTKVIDLFERLRLIAEQKAGQQIPVLDILNGRAEDFEPETKHSHFTKYMGLLNLAHSILRNGLENPISVLRHGSGYIIESGEHRWLAYHILNHFIGDDWSKIPAIERKPNNSVWRQVDENNQVYTSNPIEQARALALLYMDCKGGRIDYMSWDDIVVPGGCDRIYYAQAREGDLPRGMGGRIRSAMRMEKTNISYIYSLLDLFDGQDNAVADIIWLRADDEHWSLRTLRGIRKLPLDTVREIVQDPSFTVGDLNRAIERFDASNRSGSDNPDDDSAKPVPPPKNSLKPGVIILRRLGDYWRIEEADYMNDEFLCVSPSGFSQRIKHSDIAGIDNNKADLFKAKPKSDKPSTGLKLSHNQPADFKVGQRVIIDGNPDIKGAVSYKSAGGYTVNLMAGGSQWFEKSRLTPVDKFSNSSAQPRGAVTPTIKEEGDTPDDETDYTTPKGDEVNNGDGGHQDDPPVKTPKPVDMQLVIQKLADIAALLDLPGQPILDDLAKLDRERLQAIIQDGRYDLLEQLMNDYYKATTDATEKIRQWGHGYIDTIRAAGFEMLKGH